MSFQRWIGISLVAIAFHLTGIHNTACSAAQWAMSSAHARVWSWSQAIPRNCMGGAAQDTIRSWLWCAFAPCGPGHGSATFLRCLKPNISVPSSSILFWHYLCYTVELNNLIDLRSPTNMSAKLLEAIPLAEATPVSLHSIRANILHLVWVRSLGALHKGWWCCSGKSLNKASNNSQISLEWFN